MQYQERECLQCGNLFEGRANKKFCSDICRSQFHRDNGGVDDTNNEEFDDEEEPENDGSWRDNTNSSDESRIHGTRIVSYGQKGSSASFHSLEDERLKQYEIRIQLRKQTEVEEAEEAEEAEEEALEAARKAAREEAKQIKSLHALYSALITRCLKSDGQELNKRELRTWVNELDSATEEYMSHPGLRQLEDKAHKLLKDLYWLQDMFSDLLSELMEQQASFFKMVKPVFLELPTKRKARFRAHLVA